MIQAVTCIAIIWPTIVIWSSILATNSSQIFIRSHSWYKQHLRLSSNWRFRVRRHPLAISIEPWQLRIWLETWQAEEGTPTIRLSSPRSSHCKKPRFRACYRIIQKPRKTYNPQLALQVFTRARTTPIKTRRFSSQLSVTSVPLKGRITKEVDLSLRLQM